MAEYPNDPERPEVPNTSRSEPSSRLDPGRFWWNHRPVVWWIWGGLGALVVIGMIGVVLVVRETDQTESRGDPPEANARPVEPGSSAVAGQGTGHSITVSIKDGTFEPPSASVPRSGTASFAVLEGTCHLNVDGDEKAVLFEGDAYDFEASTPGDYEVRCDPETQDGGPEAEPDGFRLTVP